MYYIANGKLHFQQQNESPHLKPVQQTINKRSFHGSAFISAYLQQMYLNDVID